MQATVWLMHAKIIIGSHMAKNYLSGVSTLCLCVELAEVINQRSHAGWKFQHSVYQLAQGDLTLKYKSKSLSNLIAIIHWSLLILCDHLQANQAYCTQEVSVNFTFTRNYVSNDSLLFTKVVGLPYITHN